MKATAGQSPASSITTATLAERNFAAAALRFRSDLSSQPGLGHGPVSGNGAGRDLKHFSYLGRGQSTKITHFDHRALLRIYQGQSVEGLIQRNQFRRAVVSFQKHFTKRNAERSPAPLGSQLCPGVIKQDTAHDLTGDPKKMG